MNLMLVNLMSLTSIRVDQLYVGPGGRGTGRSRDRVEEGRDSAEQGAG